MYLSVVGTGHADVCAAQIAVGMVQVRVDYTNPATKAGPLVYKLRTLGIDGEGAAALPAVPGYDNSTGVGSPRKYIQHFLQS